MSLFTTPGTAAHQAPLCSSISQSLLKFMSTELVMLSIYLIRHCPLLLLPSAFPSIRVFPMSRLFTSGGQSIGALATVLPRNIQGWFPLGLTDLISLQSKGLSSLLQHHSSKASIIRCSTFFIAQLSHLYGNTGKIVTLTRWTFVCKVMSLLFIVLSRLVITFLPGSKHLLILWPKKKSGIFPLFYGGKISQ